MVILRKSWKSIGPPIHIVYWVSPQYIGVYCIGGGVPQYNSVRCACRLSSVRPCSTLLPPPSSPLSGPIDLVPVIPGLPSGCPIGCPLVRIFTSTRPLPIQGRLPDSGEKVGKFPTSACAAKWGKSGEKWGKVGKFPTSAMGEKWGKVGEFPTSELPAVGEAPTSARTTKRGTGGEVGTLGMWVRGYVGKSSLQPGRLLLFTFAPLGVQVCLCLCVRF